ncbi:hypothetical protein B566_EDAN011621, partial [Ephemera danica]
MLTSSSRVHTSILEPKTKRVLRVIQTTAGTVYEGILRTFSPQFEVVLEMAHCVDPSQPSTITVETIVEKLIFRACDIITIHARDVDLEYATKDAFQTDTAISRFNGQVAERELEPWVGPCNGDDLELEASTKENGWDANDMFRRNENVYGVQSSYDHSLSGYTVPLQRKDTKDYKDAEAKAARIASEIENTVTHRSRADLENGDEEERFAAVVRGPESPPPQLSPAPEAKANSNAYVPPAKRKNLPPQQSPQQQQHQQHMHQQQTPPPQSGPQKPMRTTPSPGVQHVSHHHHVSQGGKSYAPPPPFQQQQPQQPPPPFSPQTPPPAPMQQQQQQHHPGHQGPMSHNMPPMGYPNQGMNKMNNGMDKQKQHNNMGMVQNRPARRNMYPDTRFHENKHHQPPPGLAPSNVPYAPQATSPVVAPTMTPPPPQHMQHVAHQQQAAPELKPPQQHPHQVPSPQQQQQQQQEVVAAMHSQQQQQQHQSMPQGRPPLDNRKPPVSLPQRVGREEQYADLKRFGQDFKLVAAAPLPQQEHSSEAVESKPVAASPQQLPPQQVQQPPQPQQQQVPTQPATTGSPVPKPLQQPQQQPVQPVQPAQSPAMSDDAKGDVDKVTSTLKKSTLNPNAKEFVFNPTAKPFTPRSPSTPSRPHTPQTPQPQYTATANVQGVPMMMVVSQPQFNPSNQGGRFRKMPLQTMPHHHRPEIASQMQVAAATGQPLLAPAPITTQFYNFPQAAAHMQLAAGNPQYPPT